MHTKFLLNHSWLNYLICVLSIDVRVILILINFQFAVTTASGNEESVSTAVYLAILKGLERLLLTDVLSQQDSEVIMKLGVDR